MKPGEREKSYSARSHFYTLALILFIYFVLAFYRIGHQSLWVDEVLSLENAAPDGSIFAPSILFSGQGPLYFALLHLWARFGIDESFLRSLSALLGGGVVFLTYVIGARLCN